MKRELPDDLARLGLYLEVAAGETLRRRARRQAMANFVGAVTLAVGLHPACPSARPSSSVSVRSARDTRRRAAFWLQPSSRDTSS